MVLVLDWHCVILPVVLFHGFLGWEVEELSTDFDGLGICLVLLDLHNIIHCSFQIERLHILLEFAILNLGVSKNIFNIQHQEL